ncbi:hypothetical protein BCR33DRAFT_724936 [Rhizoclosmatium globosum]|uniref:Uncharacterized protein n=1 Tax=Rhizoclosmatium globosum TaxID=329046 RepID=A0A1Y2B1Y3_9FUNG|nr:hypothetical protein BCR33DRAFT_724936 [Rhizoclosmatium globosum]|eukprot:ORY28744.1 hypothetical protein BCR33DRAFT_724936 [Rhizoclosmatium globosum]
MSTAARLLLARAGSGSTLNSDAVGRHTPGIGSASSIRSRVSGGSGGGSATRLRGSANAKAPGSGSAAKTRPIDSAHTFNAPSAIQVLSKNSYAVPKHKRPLSSGVRKFLVDAVVEDCVHPKLGAEAALKLKMEAGTGGIGGEVQGLEAIGGVAIDGVLKKLVNEAGKRVAPFVKSLHYHLHPPRLPIPGLGMEPYNAKEQKPPIEAFRLEIPRKLTESLHDPRNLVGLEGEKVGGRILMRKFSCLYEVPKCPRVNGRITPVHSKSNLGKVYDDDETDINTLDLPLEPQDQPTVHFAAVAEAAEEMNIRQRTPPPTIDQIIQTMVLTNAEEDELETDLATPSNLSREKHRRTRAEVRQSFTKMVGSVFPLDYFMDQEEIDVLISRVEQWKLKKGPIVQCQGLIQKFENATRSRKQVEEIWHSGYLSDYDAKIKQFRIEWDEPYPTRRPINYIHIPDPSSSSRWLSRAEIKLDKDSPQGHLNHISKANIWRAEFESKLTQTQICGMVAPVVTPSLPGFQKVIVDLMYKQIAYVQGLFMNAKKRRTSSANADQEFDIRSFQSSFVAEILNELRDTYFLSQVQASIQLNPRLECLYAPKKLKKLLALSEIPHKFYSTNPKKFLKNLNQVQSSPFLVYSQVIGKLLNHLRVDLMIECGVSDLLNQVCRKEKSILRCARQVEFTTSLPSDNQEVTQDEPKYCRRTSKTGKLTSKKVARISSTVRIINAKTQSTIEPAQLHKLPIVHVWNDMYKNDLYDFMHPLFDESLTDVEIKQIVRQNISALKVISLKDFEIISDVLLEKFKTGLSTTLGTLGSQEYSQALAKHKDLSIKKGTSMKATPLSESAIHFIILANLSNGIKARYLDLVKVLRDGELHIGVDARLLLTPKREPEPEPEVLQQPQPPQPPNRTQSISMRDAFRLQQLRSGSQTHFGPSSRQPSTAVNVLPVEPPSVTNPSIASTNVSRVLRFPYPPFVAQLEIVAYPDPTRVSKTIETVLSTWLDEHPINLFPESKVITSQSPTLEGDQTIRIFTTTPIDHRALSMLSKELITDTLESTTALLLDRQQLINQWVIEFESSVSQGVWVLLQNLTAQTTSSVAFNSTRSSISSTSSDTPRESTATNALPSIQAPQSFINTLQQIQTGFSSAIHLLSLISQRAAYTFNPGLIAPNNRFPTASEKSAYYKMLASSGNGTCNLELRGFCAVRCSLLQTGVEMWIARWHDWIEQCVGVLLEKCCDDVRKGLLEVEKLLLSSRDPILEEDKEATHSVRQSTVKSTVSSRQPSTIGVGLTQSTISLTGDVIRAVPNVDKDANVSTPASLRTEVGPSIQNSTDDKTYDINCIQIIAVPDESAPTVLESTIESTKLNNVLSNTVEASLELERTTASEVETPKSLEADPMPEKAEESQQTIRTSLSQEPMQNVTEVEVQTSTTQQPLRETVLVELPSPKQEAPESKPQSPSKPPTPSAQLDADSTVNSLRVSTAPGKRTPRSRSRRPSQSKTPRTQSSSRRPSFVPPKPPIYKELQDLLSALSDFETNFLEAHLISVPDKPDIQQTWICDRIRLQGLLNQ